MSRTGGCGCIAIVLVLFILLSITLYGGYIF